MYVKRGDNNGRNKECSWYLFMSSDTHRNIKLYMHIGFISSRDLFLK